VRDRIFEPGVTTKAGGWGVGLSLSLRIVEELHHGRITVHGRPRGGTVFDVVLPVARM
jgi:signal transduction histidine kinase